MRLSALVTQARLVDFFAEIVGKIRDEEIENRLMDRIDSELAKVGA